MRCTVARFIGLIDQIAAIRRYMSGDSDLGMDKMAERTERELVVEDMALKREGKYVEP